MPGAVSTAPGSRARKGSAVPALDRPTTRRKATGRLGLPSRGRDRSVPGPADRERVALGREVSDSAAHAPAAHAPAAHAPVKAAHAPVKAAHAPVTAPHAPATAAPRPARKMARPEAGPAAQRESGSPTPRGRLDRRVHSGDPARARAAQARDSKAHDRVFRTALLAPATAARVRAARVRAARVRAARGRTARVRTARGSRPSGPRPDGPYAARRLRRPAAIRSLGSPARRPPARLRRPATWFRGPAPERPVR